MIEDPGIDKEPPFSSGDMDAFYPNHPLHIGSANYKTHTRRIKVPKIPQQAGELGSVSHFNSLAVLEPKTSPSRGIYTVINI